MSDKPDRVDAANAASTIERLEVAEVARAQERYRELVLELDAGQDVDRDELHRTMNRIGLGPDDLSSDLAGLKAIRRDLETAPLVPQLEQRAAEAQARFQELLQKEKKLEADYKAAKRKIRNEFPKASEAIKVADRRLDSATAAADRIEDQQAFKPESGEALAPKHFLLRSELRREQANSGWRI